MSDEYALLIAFVEHVESGAADYELSLNQHHSKPDGWAVYFDNELKFVVPRKDMSKWLIAPSRLKPFEDRYLRQKYRRVFRLEDEPME